jgi:ELWxxDGT repeat protein
MKRVNAILGLGLVGGLCSAMTLSCGSDEAGSSGGTSGEGGGGGIGGSGSGGDPGTGGVAGSGSPSCDDGTMNGDETDVDCGGSCASCELGAACEGAGDCESDYCIGGLCCNSACEGACEACDNVGSEGQCSPVPEGSDPKDACLQGAGAETCDGASQCHCSNGVSDADEELADCGGTGCDSCWHFFRGYTAAAGWELWKTDGTNAGTSLVKDINPAGDSSPGYMVWMRGESYFVATDGTAGTELWKTDGTEAGTVMVKDINSLDESNPRDLTLVNGELFFTADDGTAGTELWKTDGTEAGTVMVKDVFPGTQGSRPGELAPFNGQLYFAAHDGASGDSGDQLWKTDGTEAGTVRITNITESWLHPTIGMTESAISPEDLTPSGGQLYFSAWKKSTGRELWVSDGVSGASQLQSFYTGEGDGFGSMVAYQDGLIVSAAKATASPAYRLHAYLNGSFVELAAFGNGFQQYLTTFNGEVFFVGNGGTGGIELWKSDGTVAGTQIVKDIAAGDVSSSPRNLRVHGDTLYFYVENGTPGLWKTDGTENGTVHVADVSFSGGVSFRGTILFSYMCQPWKTDGTPSGTVLVSDKVTCP